jgi:hypothetical protein
MTSPDYYWHPTFANMQSTLATTRRLASVKIDRPANNKENIPGYNDNSAA